MVKKPNLVFFLIYLFIIFFLKKKGCKSMAKEAGAVHPGSVSGSRLLRRRQGSVVQGPTGQPPDGDTCGGSIEPISNQPRLIRAQDFPAASVRACARTRPAWP